VIVIADYGLGNLSSLENMFRYVGLEAERSSDPEDLVTADKIVLPGIGAFDSGMAALKQSGITEALEHSVLEKGTPVLGICLGMQMMFCSSEEGRLPGLSWLHGCCRKFAPNDDRLVPHMGWNVVNEQRSSPLTVDTEDGDRFYFVHSYFVDDVQDEVVVMRTPYSSNFVSVVQKGNIFGVQFHPEKSHRFGAALLKRFGSIGSC
jgi:glutamine amidotransferase